MRKPRSHSEVYNDTWDIVVNVFRVLRDPVLALRLKEMLILTPYSRVEFELSGDAELNNLSDPVEKARRTILRSFGGFGSASTNALHSTGFRANNRSNGTNCAVDWKNYPDNLASFVDRLKGVVIENKDYREVISQQDSRQTLFFLDPPYVHATRNMNRGNAAYAHEFTDQDHIDMAREVKQLQGNVIICGYESALYEDLFKTWVKVKRKAFGDGAVERIECLWMNYKLQNSLFL